MKQLINFALVAAVGCLMSNSLQADVVDFLDFSNDGDGVIHSTDPNFVIPNGPVNGGTAPNDWVLSYNAQNITTDSTINEFQAIGGILRVQDWGGLGTLTGSWTATEDGTIDINGVGVSIGSDAFNSTVNNGPGVSLPEGITWFYSINGGAAVEVFLGETELGGPVSAGTDVGNSFTDIAISSGDVVDYGFAVAVDGSGDGVEIASVEVDFVSAVPEPSSATVLLVGMIGLVARRKRV